MDDIVRVVDATPPSVDGASLTRYQAFERLGASG
jgi:hypothetical protein